MCFSLTSRLELATQSVELTKLFLAVTQNQPLTTSTHYFNSSKCILNIEATISTSQEKATLESMALC